MSSLVLIYIYIYFFFFPNTICVYNVFFSHETLSSITKKNNLSDNANKYGNKPGNMIYAHFFWCCVLSTSRILLLPFSKPSPKPISFPLQFSLGQNAWIPDHITYSACLFCNPHYGLDILLFLVEKNTWILLSNMILYNTKATMTGHKRKVETS